MPQGHQKKTSLKKNPTGLKKSKTVRGDQQKLKRGSALATLPADLLTRASPGPFLIPKHTDRSTVATAPLQIAS